MLCNLCTVGSDMSKVGALLQQKLCGEKVVALLQQRLCGKKWGRYFFFFFFLFFLILCYFFTDLFVLLKVGALLQQKLGGIKWQKLQKLLRGSAPLLPPPHAHLHLCFQTNKVIFKSSWKPPWTRAYVDCRYFQLSYSRLPQNQWYYLFIYFFQQSP